MTKILIKKLSKETAIPKYETEDSSGMDIIANINKEVEILPGERTVIPSGFSLSIPKGFEIQIRPRSGLAAKKGISVLNTPGTIDADYRGEVKVILINLSKEKFIVEKGMRIAQMVVSPVTQVKLEEVKELPKTSRGTGGFGSTGIK